MNYEIGIGKVGEGNEQLDCFARFRSIRISILLRIVFQEQTLNIRREKNSVFHRNMRPVFIILSTSVKFEKHKEKHVQVQNIYHN